MMKQAGVLVLAFFLFFFAVQGVFAQPFSGKAESSQSSAATQKTGGPASVSQQEPVSRDECIANFDINNINLSESEIFPLIPLLSEYFSCKAAATDDISACDKLTPWPDRINRCKTNYREYHLSLGKLLTMGQVTTDIINAWKFPPGLTKENSTAFLKGLVSADASACDAFAKNLQNECKAQILGDSKFCSETSCNSKVSYIKAIKANDVKACRNLSNKNVSAMCGGILDKDTKNCENNQSFIEFRNKYCDYKSRRK